METIRVNDKEYPIKFGYGALRKFAHSKGISEVNKVDEIFAGINFDNMTFEQVDDIGELIFCAVEIGCEYYQKDFDLSLVHITELYFSDVDQITKAIELFAESMPKEQKGKAEKKAIP